MVGHGRTETATAAEKQASELAYFPLWSYAHPAAIKLADRIATLAPGDPHRVFFTTSGSEAVEAAWQLPRSYFTLQGEPTRTNALGRALSCRCTPLRAPA